MFTKIKKFFLDLKYKILKNKITLRKEFQDKSKEYLEIQNQIELEKKEIKQEKKRIKLPSQSKMFLIFLFVNFTLMEGFIGYITIKSITIAQYTGLQIDFSPLVTFISLVVGEIISYGIYTAKSKAENTKDGIVYETAMRNLEKENNEETMG